MGILIKCNPLLNKLAAKPPTSPVIPPPIANKLSSLEKFLFSKISKIEFIISLSIYFNTFLSLPSITNINSPLTFDLVRFKDLEIQRKIFIHINTTNPALLENSKERKTANDLGWEIAYDSMEIKT